MSITDIYREIAEDLKDRAEQQEDQRLRLQYESFARKYFSLATQAEQNQQAGVGTRRLRTA